MRRLILLLILSLAGLSQAETVHWYIDQDVASAGDGTSWANAYQTWAAFQTAHGTDLVTAEDIYHVHFQCSSGTAATLVNVAAASWTTSATYYLILEVDDPWTGAWTTSKFRAVGASADNGLYLAVPYTRVIGFQFDAGTSYAAYLANTADYSVFYRCLARDSVESGFYISASTPGVVLAYCAAFSTGRYGVEAKSSITLYNCVAANNVSGQFVLNANYLVMTATNCYAGAPAEGGVGFAAGTDPTWTLTDCASWDGSPAAAPTTTVAFATDSGGYFTSITDAAENLHIGALSSLRDVGTDVSSSLVYTVDVDEQAVPQNGTFDIGYDEYVGGLSIARKWWHHRRS